MNNDMIELCAKALWDRSQKDPANQYKVGRMFKMSGPVSWAQINDADIIPNLAEECRESSITVIAAMRRWLAAYSEDDQGMLDLFVVATATNGE